MFSFIVLPVTVRQSPCMRPSSMSIRISGTVPPIFTRSFMKYLPLGFRSANTGVFLPMRTKSSRPSLTPAAWAIAMRCRTALVEPPSVMMSVMAFSKASFVMISRGVMPSLIMFMTAAPASKQSMSLSLLTAAWAPELGRLMPMASIALAMVLAVYMPPQEPSPGIECSSMSWSCASLILQFACCPTASKTVTMSASFFSTPTQPGRMVPP